MPDWPALRLEQQGHRVTWVKNGPEAVAAFKRERLRSDSDGSANAGHGRH